MELIISDQISSDIVMGNFDEAIERSRHYFNSVTLQLIHIQAECHLYEKNSPQILSLNQMIQNVNGCLAWIVTSESSTTSQKNEALHLIQTICNLPDPFNPCRMFTPFNSPLFKAVNEARPDSVRLWVNICDIFYEDPDSGQWAIGYIPQQSGGIDDPDRDQRRRCFEIVFNKMVQLNPKRVSIAFKDYIRPIGIRLGFFTLETELTEVHLPL